MGKSTGLNISLDLSEIEGRVKRIVPNSSLSKKGTTLEIVCDRVNLKGIKAIENKNFFKFHSVLNCEMDNGEKVTLIQREKSRIKVTGKNIDALITFLQRLCSFTSTQELKFSW